MPLHGTRASDETKRQTPMNVKIEKRYRHECRRRETGCAERRTCLHCGIINTANVVQMELVGYKRLTIERYLKFIECDTSVHGVWWRGDVVRLIYHTLLPAILFHYFTDSTMAAYVGLSQHIDFGRLQSPGDRFELRDMIGEGECGMRMVTASALRFISSTYQSLTPVLLFPCTPSMLRIWN